MYLTDASGTPVAFNDDRDEFNENPLIDHKFEREGIYYVKLDQYRGPRGFNFGKNCSYTLRILLSQRCVPSRRSDSKRPETQIRLRGTALGRVEKVYLTEARRAEYARMTYPYTMPIHFRPDPPSASEITTVRGRIVSRHDDLLETEFKIPAKRDRAYGGSGRRGRSGHIGCGHRRDIELPGIRRDHRRGGGLVARLVCGERSPR